jgi:hypothetical protein
VVRKGDFTGDTKSKFVYDIFEGGHLTSEGVKESDLKNELDQVLKEIDGEVKVVKRRLPVRKVFDLLVGEEDPEEVVVGVSLGEVLAKLKHLLEVKQVPEEYRVVSRME